MLKYLFLLTVMSFQPRHITMTSIDYFSEDSINVYIKLDYNILLRDYQQTLDDDIDVEQFRDRVLFPSDLANYYVNSKLVLHANGKPMVGKILKMEKKNEIISLNVLYRPGKRLKTITVKNTFLTGLFSNVENLTIIKSGHFEKGVKFTQQYTQEIFPLK